MGDKTELLRTKFSNLGSLGRVLLGIGSLPMNVLTPSV